MSEYDTETPEMRKAEAMKAAQICVVCFKPIFEWEEFTNVGPRHRECAEKQVGIIEGEDARDLLDLLAGER